MLLHFGKREQWSHSYSASELVALVRDGRVQLDTSILYYPFGPIVPAKLVPHLQNAFQQRRSWKTKHETVSRPFGSSDTVSGPTPFPYTPNRPYKMRVQRSPTRKPTRIATPITQLYRQKLTARRKESSETPAPSETRKPWTRPIPPQEPLVPVVNIVAVAGFIAVILNPFFGTILGSLCLAFSVYKLPASRRYTPGTVISALALASGLCMLYMQYLIRR